MKKILWVPLSMLTVSLMLSGCGSTGNPQSGTTAPSAGSAAEESSESVEMKLPDQGGNGPEAGAGLDSTGSGGSQRIQASEVAMELSIEPADTKDMIDKLKQFTAEKGGYISALETSLYEPDEEEEDAEEDTLDSKKAKNLETKETDEASAYDDYDGYGDSYYDDYYSYYNSHWTTMTIVLPSSETDTLVKQLSADYKVLDQRETLTDYTAKYRAMLDKQAALEDEEERLIALLEDARSSNKSRSSDSDFLEKVIQLENNLWQTRSDLNECRFGSADSYSYYYDDAKGLYEFEEMNGMSTVELDIYIDPEK